MNSQAICSGQRRQALLVVLDVSCIKIVIKWTRTLNFVLSLDGDASCFCDNVFSIGKIFHAVNVRAVTLYTSYIIQEYF